MGRTLKAVAVKAKVVALEHHSQNGYAIEVCEQ